MAKEEYLDAIALYARVPRHPPDFTAVQSHQAKVRQALVSRQVGGDRSHLGRYHQGRRVRCLLVTLIGGQGTCALYSSLSILQSWGFH